MNQEPIMKSPLNNPLIRFISDKKFRWLRHTAFIGMGIILAFKGDIGVSSDSRSPEMIRTIIQTDIISFIILMSLIYLTILVLIPRLLFRSKFFLFSLSILIIVSLIYFLVYWVDAKYLVPADRLNATPQMQHIELSLISYVQLSAVSLILFGSVIGMAIFKKWINDVQRMNELHQTNLRTELEQLKSQINPHFLFNTLNNLLVLTRTDPDKASRVLLGLSDLLRYLLYDGAHDTILLSKDLGFIRNLLSLEKIRKTDFDFQISTDDQISNISIPPFLFVPFVENAIKHGAPAEGHSYLNLNFTVRDQHLHFTAENSKPQVKNKTVGGLGLKNIRRRLELLYPENHSLEIVEEQDKYFVHLILPV
jgi:sensor histidine kinase YesM